MAPRRICMALGRGGHARREIMQRLQRQVAIVTDGSSGIGATTAQIFGFVTGSSLAIDGGYTAH